MKTQMRFQKILMLVSLIVAALTFVYALFFLTGSLGYATQYKGEYSIGAENLVSKSQGFVDSMVVLCIIFILLAAFMFVTSSHSRRNYYITNYIAIGLFVAFALFLVIYIIVNIVSINNIFLTEIDWEKVPAKVQELRNAYPMSKNDTYTFTVGYIMAVILLVNAVFLVLNVVWKVLLMKGEKQLLAGAANAQAEEVA